MMMMMMIRSYCQPSTTTAISIAVSAAGAVARWRHHCMLLVVLVSSSQITMFNPSVSQKLEYLVSYIYPNFHNFFSRPRPVMQFCLKRTVTSVTYTTWNDI